MPIGLSTEQRDLADAVTAWTSTAPTQPWKGAASIGLFSIAVAEEYGGDGGSIVDAATALERCAAALVSGPLLPTVVVGAVLSRAAALSPEVLDLLRRTVSGDLVCALAVGSVEGADADGGIVVDRGATTVIGDADADVVLVAVHVAEQDSVRWCLLDVGRSPTADVRIEERESHDETRGVGTVHLSVTAAPERVLDIDPRCPWDLATTAAAAEATGISSWCTATAAEYAATRVQFGRPIGSFQSIKHLCAQMLCLEEQSVAMTWSAARACDGVEVSAAVASAAALVFDNAVRAAKDCIQVLGGIGFTWEHDAHRYLRRATALRQLFGLSVPYAAGMSWQRRCAENATEEPDDLPRALDELVTDPDVLGRARTTIAEVSAASADERRPVLADAGLMMPSWPVPHGLGADAATALVVDAELEAAGIDRPDLGIGAWALPTIIMHGNDIQRERFVPPTLRGEITWCQLFSEPEAGSDLASLRTTARRVDGGWILNGQKVWTSNAQSAQWAVCLARTGGGGNKGITYFLVDMSTSGLTVRPLREMTGDALFNEVFLDEVFVPDDCVVGAVDGGWALTRTTLTNERVSMGTSRAMGVDAAGVVASWAASPLRDDAVTAARVGTMVAVGTSVSLLGRRALLRRVHGHGPGAESSVQKLIGVEHRQNAADLGLDLLGAAGVFATRETSTEMYHYLLTRCLSIAGGSTQILRTVVGERLLGLPREPAVGQS